MGEDQGRREFGLAVLSRDAEDCAADRPATIGPNAGIDVADKGFLPIAKAERLARIVANRHLQLFDEGDDAFGAFAILGGMHRLFSRSVSSHDAVEVNADYFLRIFRSVDFEESKDVNNSRAKAQGKAAPFPSLNPRWVPPYSTQSHPLWKGSRDYRGGCLTGGPPLSDSPPNRPDAASQQQNEVTGRGGGLRYRA